MEVVGKDAGNWTPPARASSDGFEEFVQRHYKPLAKALALMTLDKQLAADAAQDAFLRLQLRWSNGERLEDPVAWLYRVAINRCHDYHRQLGRATRLFDRILARVGTDDTHHSWAPEVEFSSLIQQLPRQQRVAAVLFYQGDLSTAEIARVMRISEGAVKSHLYRARETLRPMVQAD
jgi:RNA polymerase sigma-70 factor (ECF subfamily)